jgi:hypothetical protein
VNISSPLLEQIRRDEAERRAQRRATSAKRKMAKASEERQQPPTQWQRRRDDQVKALAAGPHGEAARELIEFLSKLKLGQARELIAHAERWRDTDEDTRYLVLGLFSDALARARENAGLAPFDDPLPDEPDSVFVIIREILMPVRASRSASPTMQESVEP